MKKSVIISMSLLSLFSSIQLSARPCVTPNSSNYDLDGCPRGDWREKCLGCTFDDAYKLTCLSCGDKKDVSQSLNSPSDTAQTENFK